jgi:DNA-directed RNA polymerase beta' subunit
MLEPKPVNFITMEEPLKPTMRTSQQLKTQQSQQSELENILNDIIKRLNSLNNNAHLDPNFDKIKKNLNGIIEQYNNGKFINHGNEALLKLALQTAKDK